MFQCITDALAGGGGWRACGELLVALLGAVGGCVRGPSPVVRPMPEFSIRCLRKCPLCWNLLLEASWRIRLAAYGARLERVLG